MFSGIFYRRFILGEWAFADGVVYDCFDINRNTYRDFEREQILPLVVLDNDPWDGYPFYGVDYGVFNPQVFLEIYKYNKPGDKIPYFYVDKEYYYDSRKKMKQKTTIKAVSYMSYCKMLMMQEQKIFFWKSYCWEYSWCSFRGSSWSRSRCGYRNKRKKRKNQICMCRRTRI